MHHRYIIASYSVFITPLILLLQSATTHYYHSSAISIGMSTTSITSTTTPRSIAKAAIAQLQSTSSKHTNLLNISKCAGWAKRHGAQILFLPECCGYIGHNAQQTLANADPSIDELLTMQKQRGGQWWQSDTEDDSSSISVFRKALADTISSCAENEEDENNELASATNSYIDKESLTSPITSIISELCFIANESKLWISGGGVHTSVHSQSTKLNDDDEHDERKKIYNTHVIIDDNGQIQSYYHKIHLFDVSIPNENVNLRESNTTSPGTKLVVCNSSPIGTLGLSICYDMRFPEMYVDLVQRMGAQVLLMPSAFTVPTGRAHWHALLKARAIESQCYVIAAAQVGQHNEKRQSYGHSVAYDPWGKLLADAGGYDGKGTSEDATTSTISSSRIIYDESSSPVRVPSVSIVDIDLDKLASVRERMPIQQHRDNSNFS